MKLQFRLMLERSDLTYEELKPVEVQEERLKKYGGSDLTYEELKPSLGALINTLLKSCSDLTYEELKQNGNRPMITADICSDLTYEELKQQRKSSTNNKKRNRFRSYL